MLSAPARLLLSATFALTAFFALATSASAQASRMGEWKGFIAIDAQTGQTLVEDNADVVTPPASMTKLMTFAIVHDKIKSGALSLSTVVQVTREDARMGGTQVYLDPSESFTVEDLIHAIMIQSANDASHALARASAGSVEAFVELMNAKARELGMKNTTFRTPHGLPPSSRKVADGDLSTPRDFALLCRYLVKNTDVLKFSSVKDRPFGLNRPKGPMQMANHNKLLGRVEGVDGLKTGYTKAAGYCLSATALRNNRRVVAVIMGSFGPGGQVDLGAARDRKMIDILGRAFAAIPANSPAFVGPAESPISAAPVEAGSPIAPAPSGNTSSSAPAPADEPPAVRFVLPKK